MSPSNRRTPRSLDVSTSPRKLKGVVAQDSAGVVVLLNDPETTHRFEQVFLRLLDEREAQRRKSESTLKRVQPGSYRLD